jgi:hypothetical protein
MLTPLSMPMMANQSGPCRHKCYSAATPDHCADAGVQQQGETQEKGAHGSKLISKARKMANSSRTLATRAYCKINPRDVACFKIEVNRYRPN